MPERDLPRPNWPLYLGLAAAWLACGLILTTSAWVTHRQARAFIDAGYILLPLAGAAASLRHAHARTGRLRLGWLTFAVAFLSWSLAGTLWFRSEVFLGETPPFPAPSDAAFLGYAVLATFALLVLAESWGPRLRGLELLDALFIASTVGFALHDLLLRDAFTVALENPLALVTATAYPVVDTLVLATVLLTLTRTWPRRRTQPTLIAGGLALLAFTDLAWVYQTANGSYTSGGPFDLLWHLSFIVVVMGIVHRQVDGQVTGSEAAPASRHLVHVGLGCLVAALLASHAFRTGLDALQLGLLATILVVLVVRQAMALAQNERLRSRISADAQAVQDLNVQLREAAAAKARFLNATAHELNNPLTPMRIQVKLLSTLEDPERRQRSVGILARNIDRLRRLVADLLDLARLESGTFQVSLRDVHLQPIVQDAVQLYQGQERGIGITTSLDDVPPVVADAERLGQILANFLTNAVKYSPDGAQVHVAVRPDGDHVRIEVRDAGPGLTEDQIARLFKAFAQVHESPVQKQGTGLGLYISSQLARLMGGDAGCHSAGPGQGSVFWVRLPKASGAPPASSAFQPE